MSSFESLLGPQDRRAVLGQLALLLGVAAVPAEVLAAPTRRTRRLLDAPRTRLLNAVADTIVPQTDTPGAVAVGVPKRLDGLLRDWASPATREKLVGALANIEAAAQAQHKRAFAALNPADRKTLLTAHDLAALKQVPRTEKLTGIAAMLAGPSVADPGYSRLKGLIVTLYYYSEAALTTELQYDAVPGGWTPSVPVTPDTRPEGGFTFF